jgi:hypothetical protein
MKGRWLIVAAVAAQACTATTFPLGDRPVDVGLAFQETRAVPGTAMALTFERVVGDSRCPVDVTCVWAGNAEVQIGATLAGGFHRSYRVSSFVEPHAFDVGSYHVTLLRVSPDRHENVPVDSLDYSVELRVEGH